MAQTVERWRGRALQAMRLRVLGEEPWCRICRSKGRNTKAVVVDHIIRLVDGGTYRRSNLQPLCQPCHDEKSAADAGKRSRMAACDVHGNPLDPAHPWHRP